VTEFAREWIRAIAGAALICAAASALTHRGRVKSVMKLVCGIVLVLATVNPLLGQRLPGLSLDMSEYRKRAEEILGEAAEKENGLSRSIIEEGLEAYILDKAKSLDTEIQSAEVLAKWGDAGCWYPYEVYITAKIPPREKDLLSNSIEAELGVPGERQYWRDYEG
jgi:hypothetical protein